MSSKRLGFPCALALLASVTEYPNRAAYLLALSDPRVAAVSSFRADGLENQWIYTTGAAEIDLGF
jgi:hypothetical protein